MVSLDKRVRRVLIGYCIAIAVACTYVPWKIPLSSRSISLGDFSLGYALIWAPPTGLWELRRGSVASVDVTRVALLVVALTAVAGVVILFRCRSSPAGKGSPGGLFMSVRKQAAWVRGNLLPGYKAVMRFFRKRSPGWTAHPPARPDYSAIYADLRDEELAHLAESRNDLTEAARAALDTEITTRGLTGVAQGTRSL